MVYSHSFTSCLDLTWFSRKEPLAFGVLTTQSCSIKYVPLRMQAISHVTKNAIAAN